VLQSGIDEQVFMYHHHYHCRAHGGFVRRFVVFVGMLVSVSTGSVAVAEPLH